jgi:hypothetical protein
MPPTANLNPHLRRSTSGHPGARSDSPDRLKRLIGPRISTAWHRRALTRSLADGLDPIAHPELALRATQLTSRRNRTTLAQTLRRTIAEAHRPARTRSNVVLIRRGPVLDAEDVLLALAARLNAPAPVSPQGMAQLERILTNADQSPLYNASEPHRLRQLLSAALYAMDPRGATSHEFSIGR